MFCLFCCPGGIDRQELYGNVHRPNLDGSSSDSDEDIQPTSSAVQNFVRSSVQTSRFELQHDLEDLDLRNIPGNVSLNMFSITTLFINITFLLYYLIA